MEDVSEDVKKVLEVFPDAIPLKVVNNKWTISEFRDFISKLTFTFAKTYKKFAPHEYAIFKNCGTPLKQELAKACKFIDENGYTIHFYGGSAFRCLNLDGKRYWYAYMTDDHSMPDIINRTDNTNTQGIPHNQLHLLEEAII